MVTTAQRTAVVAIVDSYLQGIGRKNLAGVPFASDVTIESPLTTKLVGVEPVSAFLTGLFPAVKDVRINRHIVDGEFDAVQFDLDTVFGVIPVFDCIRVTNGLIQEIRPYYDPRPITEGVAR
jgi:hypothetical protein